MQDMYRENTQDTENINPQLIISENETIHEYPISTNKRLPRYIPLHTSTPGQYKWMKLRSTRVLRFHKFKLPNLDSP